MNTRTRPTWLPAHLYPFVDRWMNIDGHEVHYVDEGHGPVLLMLHGNPTWSFLYRNIIVDLRKHFRCIAVDYPGFGLSQAKPGYAFRPEEHSRVVEKLVSELNLQEMLIMVQDWGGPIGLGLAGRMPERVRGLVIANTWAWPAQGDPDLEGFAKFMGGPIGSFLIRFFNVFVNVLLPLGVGSKLSKEVMRAYRGPFLARAARTPVANFPKEILASKDYLARVEAGLAALADKPALILWGAKDMAFKTKERLRFEQLFLNHRTVILENAKHYIQEDSPQLVSKEIRDWAAQAKNTLKRVS